jgi:hypothetical protein
MEASASTALSSPVLSQAACAACRVLGAWVFPLRPGTKVPATAHGFKDATNDCDRIVSWWRLSPRANIGIDCGRSGLLVVDLDGEEGRDAWADLVARNGGHERTRVCVTGTGGFHIWFFGDGPSTARRLGPGIDTRGRGGYVIAPPSVHPNGNRYRWRDSAAPIAPAPAWLLGRLKPPPPPLIGEHKPLPSGVDATPYGRAALDGMAREMRTAGEGRRHAVLCGIAYRAGRLSAGGEIDAGLARDVLREAALDAGLGRAEVASALRDCFGEGLKVPAARGGGR